MLHSSIHGMILNTMLQSREHEPLPGEHSAFYYGALLRIAMTEEHKVLSPDELNEKPQGWATYNDRKRVALWVFCHW